MAILTSKFQLVTKDSLPGAMGGIWDVFIPQEIEDAKTTGTGPGVPDSEGSTQLGTLASGTMMVLNSNYRLEAGDSEDLASNFAQMFWVIFEGDDDYSGAAAGCVTAVHGGCRIETVKFDTTKSYVPGRPLIVVAGDLVPQAAAGDAMQVVGYVGSGVNSDGVLDAYLVQG